jgi:hypothetical protein
MKVTMFFNGGPNYACFDTNNKADAETFQSLADAKATFEAHADFDPHYPCVENPEAWIFKGAHVIGADYPDYVLTLGKRGAVNVTRA